MAAAATFHHFLLAPQPSGAAFVHLLDEVHDVGCPLERLCQNLGPASQVAEVGDQSRNAATVSLLQIYGNHGESCHPTQKKSPVEMGKLHLSFGVPNFGTKPLGFWASQVRCSADIKSCTAGSGSKPRRVWLHRRP
jgi:hypothetical protein